jgi:hypothetical protein
MKRALANITTYGAVLACITLVACERPVQRDPDAAPPPGGDPVANVPVTPPDVDPNQDPDDPPDPPLPDLDPANCPMPDGTSVNCTVALSADNYCDNVYPAPIAVDLPTQPDFELVSACGACDASYFQPPADVGTCANAPDPGGVQPPEDQGVIPDSTCKTCHAPNNYDGLNSIENPHAWQTVDCVDCHGGDGTATNQTFAHVCAPPEIGNRNQQVLDTRAFFLSFTTAGVQLLPDYPCTQQNGETRTTSPLEWLAFENPGDLRAGRAGMGCGKCHVEINDYSSRSTMGNATGLHGGTRHGIGAKNKFADRYEGGPTVQNDWLAMADYGATAITNPNYDPNNRVVGEVPSLYQPEVFTGQNFRYDNTFTADAVNNSLELNNIEAYNYPNGINNQVAESLMQEVLNQACTGCHLQSKYNNNRAGDYRSAGCSACHFESGVSGRSNSNDPNVDKYEPINPNFLTPGEKVHIKDHRIRNVARAPGEQDGLFLVVQGTADQNCMVCHEGSNRTVAQYHGYRLDQNQDLTNNNFYPTNNTVVFTYRTQLFGENQFFNNRQLTQWIDTEIWQADVANVIGAAGQDETPEDVHHAVGMGCVDCHGTGATHGRGAIYSRMKLQTHQNDMLCETCHGTIDEYANNDGQYVLDQGEQQLKHIRVNDALNGEFWLVSKLNGSLH